MITLNGNLTFQSDQGEVAIRTENNSLDISFSNWKVFHLMMNSGNFKYRKLKQYLKEIATPVTVTIGAKKLVVLDRGKVKSFNIGRILKLYWTKFSK